MPHIRSVFDAHRARIFGGIGWLLEGRADRNVGRAGVSSRIPHHRLGGRRCGFGGEIVLLQGQVSKPGRYVRTLPNARRWPPALGPEGDEMLLALDARDGRPRWSELGFQNPELALAEGVVCEFDVQGVECRDDLTGLPSRPLLKTGLSELESSGSDIVGDGTAGVAGPSRSGGAQARARRSARRGGGPAARQPRDDTSARVARSQPAGTRSLDTHACASGHASRWGDAIAAAPHRRPEGPLLALRVEPSGRS